MGLFSKDIGTMDDLLLHGLKDIYYAENQIVKSLPKLIEKATNRDLTKGLKDHLEETKNQIGRLDQVFKKLGEEPHRHRRPDQRGRRGGRRNRRQGCVTPVRLPLGRLTGDKRQLDRIAAKGDTLGITGVAAFAALLGKPPVFWRVC
jgi:Domain of unknown function (DUF892)